jgi:predicted outer membrane repeat protein
MKKLASALLLTTALVLPVHAQTGSSKSVNTLTSEINSLFIDNISNAITPADLRQVTLDLVNSNFNNFGTTVTNGDLVVVSGFGQIQDAILTFNGQDQWDTTQWDPLVGSPYALGTDSGPTVLAGNVFKFVKTNGFVSSFPCNNNPQDDACVAVVQIVSQASATSAMENVGLAAYATGSSAIQGDNVAIYTSGRTTSGIGVGLGVHSVGITQVSTGPMLAAKLSANNESSHSFTYNGTFLSGGGIYVEAISGLSASNLVGCGLCIASNSGAQFDVGIGFPEVASTPGAKNYSFRDDSNSATSIQINGTHATAQIAGTGFAINSTGNISNSAMTTGTPVASVCLDASNNIIKKTTSGSCI